MLITTTTLSVSVMGMTASSKDRTSAVETTELARRLAGLWPRLALATWGWAVRQSRAVGGLDYSLIDYEGVASAAARLGLEWWLDPPRTVAALTELWWHDFSLIANRASGAMPAGPHTGGDKRFQDKAWSEDPTQCLLRDLYLINSKWLLAQVRARTNPRPPRQAQARILYAPAAERSVTHQLAGN